MHMRVRISGKALAAGLTPPREAWGRIGNLLRSRIIDRTRQRNVDADGVPFHAYSEGYAKAKAKRGGVLGGGRVNLTGTVAGRRMLDDIAVVPNATQNPRILLRFASADKATLASYHMGDGRVDREFFALSDDDVDFVHDSLRRILRGE